MKKLFLLFFLILTPFLRSHAQAVAINDTTRASFYCEAEGIRIYLDMGKESLTVPGMSFLGPVTNDIGSDSQTVELKPLPNGTYQYTALEGNNVRRVQGRKLVKVPDTMIMKRSPI